MDCKTVEIQCKGADVLPLDAITDFQGTLKKRGKKEIDAIIKSIERFGFSFPFFIWNGTGDNYCLDGHGRIQALAEMRRQGMSLPLFPVVYVDAVDESEAKQKLLRLNSQYGQMTIDSVLEFTGGMDMDWDELALPGGDFLKITSEADETVGDDEAPEAQDEAVSQLGEIYELGPHRLMCGDSTDIDQVGRLMGGEKADLWITDPPYNVAYEGKTKDALTIQNDKMNDSSFREFLKKAFSCAVEVMKPGAVYYIWHADLEGYNFRGACFDVGLKVRQCLIWNKQSMVMRRQDYHWKHEPCLYGWKDGASHLWATDRKQTTVLNFDRPSRNAEHPTMKPVELFAYQIQNNTKGEDVVLDTFGGSGTTIISSAKTGRVCRMMELDPIYCDVIRRRWTNWAKENGHEIGSGGLE